MHQYPTKSVSTSTWPHAKHIESVILLMIEIRLRSQNRCHNMLLTINNHPNICSFGALPNTAQSMAIFLSDPTSIGECLIQGLSYCVILAGISQTQQKTAMQFFPKQRFRQYVHISESPYRANHRAKASGAHLKMKSARAQCHAMHLWRFNQSACGFIDSGLVVVRICAESPKFVGSAHTRTGV